MSTYSPGEEITLHELIGVAAPVLLDNNKIASTVITIVILIIFTTSTLR
jgi:hypothetical protein